MKKLTIAIALAALGFAVAAQASPILQVVGPECGAGPCSNAGPWPVSPEDATFDAGPQGQMSIGTDEAPPLFPYNIPTGTLGYGGDYLRLVDPTATSALVTFTLMGHGDSAFNNHFAVGGACAIDWFNNTTAIGTTISCVLPTNALLPFTFFADSNATNLAVANNGGSNSNPRTPPNNTIPHVGSPPNTPDFGLFDVSQTALNQGTAFWIGLADGNVGNPGIDSDMQDMVIRVSVPEPATLALLGLGLFGLAISRRKF
jgi:hypothetical protein